jgi:hypothetical protein
MLVTEVKCNLQGDGPREKNADIGNPKPGLQWEWHPLRAVGWNLGYIRIVR